MEDLKDIGLIKQYFEGVFFIMALSSIVHVNGFTMFSWRELAKLPPFHTSNNLKQRQEHFYLNSLVVNYEALCFLIKAVISLSASGR